MEADLAKYRDRFVGARTGLAKEVDSGVVLIEDLLEELDHTTTTLEKTKLDLDNERQSRRRLQRGVGQGDQPYVVALIHADQDCHAFKDNFFAKGEAGGEDAAEVLMTALKQHLQQVTDELEAVDITVRVFADVSGMGAALERNGKLKHAGDIRAFVAGFSMRYPFFDFVDVGVGKERADAKVYEWANFYQNSLECRHVLLAFGNHSEYIPFLEQLAAYETVKERITLIESVPFTTEVRDLGLKQTQLGSVFNITQTPAPPDVLSSVPFSPAVPLSGSWLRGAPLLTPSTASINNSSIEWPRLATPIVSSLSVQSPRRLPNLKAQIQRLGPVMTNKEGRRVDKSLWVSDVTFEKIKKSGLCYHYSLRGECVNTACPHSHIHRSLTDEDFDALWKFARLGRCHRSRRADDGDAVNDCADATCVYGHLPKT